MSAKRPVVDDDRFPLDIRAQLDRIEGFVTDTLPAELAGTLAPHTTAFANLVSKTGTAGGDYVSTSRSCNGPRGSTCVSRRRTVAS